MTDAAKSLPDPSINTGKSRRGWSFYGTWQVCKRKWAYDNLGDEDVLVPSGPPTSDPRNLGTLVHALLAREYMDRMGHAQEPMRAFAFREGRRLMLPDEDIELALSRVRRHNAMYPLDFTPVAVETEYAIGILPVRDSDGGMSARVVPEGTPGSVLFSNRVDLVGEDRQRRIWTIDHKTAATVKPGTSRGYGMHGTFHGIWHLGRTHFGKRFAGPLINYVQTRSGPKFKRVRPPAAPALVQGFPMLVIAIVSEMKLWERIARGNPDKYPPATDEKVCEGRYGPCEFQARCRFGTGLL